MNINGLATAWLTPELDRGRAMLEQSLELGRKHGDNWAVADGLKIVTVTWMFQDDYENLAAPLAEFLKVSERLGNRFFIAWYHITIGWVATHRGPLNVPNAFDDERFAERDWWQARGLSSFLVRLSNLY